MKNITSTQTNLSHLARSLGLLNFPHTFHLGRVSVDQFNNGNQGSCRQVAEYNGAMLEVTLPSVYRSGCSVMPVNLITRRFIAIAGLIYPVDVIHSPWKETDCKWEVTLVSAAPLRSTGDVVREAIDKVDAEIADLQARKLDLIGRLPKSGV